MHENKYNIVINKDLLTVLLNEWHTLYLHISAVKILKMILEDFYIKGIRYHISKILRTCHICQTTKYEQKTKKLLENYKGR